MIFERATLGFVGVLAGCSQPNAPPQERPSDTIVPLAIDGTLLFVPSSWNARRPWDTRPWPNGLRVDTSGWARWKPRLGPLELAQKLPPGQTYRADSTGQHGRENRADPFFRLTATFEFPASGGKAFPFKVDMLTLSYRAPQEVLEQPYTALLNGISIDAGDHVGDGWRELKRPFEGREIAIRFDARDWRIRGGPLPRRLAASFGPASWAHYITLKPSRWTAEFDTQRLPVQHWRARYVVTDELFEWLRTEPARRDPSEHFEWWRSAELRPTQ